MKSKSAAAASEPYPADDGGEMAATAALCRLAPVPAVLLSFPDYSEVARSRPAADLLSQPGPNWRGLMRGSPREALLRGREPVELPADLGLPGRGSATPVIDAAGRLAGVMLWLGGTGAVEAQRAVAAKSRFLAAASHDLRQPFQAMRLFLGVLSSQLKDEAPLRTTRMLGQALASGEALLNSLLDISTLEAGTVQPKPQVFAIDDMCARLAQEMTPLAAEKGLELRTRLRRADVDSDPVLVERVLRNLISNAIRYTRQGTVLVGLRRRENGVLVQVWDTGFGIPDDQLALIFEEFHQLENPERDRSRGLGLGLAIVQRICRLLAIPVEVQSQLGRGSVFTIALPLAATAPTVAPPPKRRDACLTGRRILVVDDEPLVLESLRATLEGWGCAVTAAEDMADVLQALDDAEPEMLLSDLRLRNNLSGFDVIERVRAILGKPLPAVVLTGETSRAALTEGRQRGLFFLHKPVQGSQLRRAVETCLTGG